MPFGLRARNSAYGFDDIADDWCMLDPIKVSVLAPGMGDDGKLEKSGVPAALVNAWFNRFGIVPTRVTDFQVMFLFSIGITKGKWGTLLTNLLAFKRAYDQIVRSPTFCRRSQRNTQTATATSGCMTLATSCSSTYARIVRATYLTLPTKGCPMRI